MYLCKHCGNKEEFQQIAYGTQNFSEVQYLNEEGDVQDYGDRDDGDSDINDYDAVRCSNCDGLAEDVDVDEWEDWGKPKKKMPKTCNWKKLRK